MRFWASWDGQQTAPVPFEAWQKSAPNRLGDQTARYYAVIIAVDAEAAWGVIAGAFTVDDRKFCSPLGDRNPCPLRFPQSDRLM